MFNEKFNKQSFILLTITEKLKFITMLTKQSSKSNILRKRRFHIISITLRTYKPHITMRTINRSNKIFNLRNICKFHCKIPFYWNNGAKGWNRTNMTELSVPHTNRYITSAYTRQIFNGVLSI